MRREKVGPFANLAGYDASFAPFLKRRDARSSAATAFRTSATVPGSALPIHQIALVALGIDIFDNVDLQAVAETAARLK